MKYKIAKQTVIEQIIDVDLNEYVGIKVRWRRKQLKLSQVELAKRLGVSRSTVSNIESNKVPITLIMWNELTEVLKCDLLPFNIYNKWVQRVG